MKIKKVVAKTVLEEVNIELTIKTECDIKFTSHLRGRGKVVALYARIQGEGIKKIDSYLIPYELSGDAAIEYIFENFDVVL